MNQGFAENFVQYLENMEGDRGKLAMLRRGLIDHQAHVTWPLLSRFIDFDRPYQTKALQTMAGLFAHHPKNVDSGNFGDLCYQLLETEERQKISQGKVGPISRQFQFVLAADGEEIFPRVRRIVLRVKRDEIPVNYVQLAKDLLGWQRPYIKDRIKLAWGKSFWRISAEIENNNPEKAEEGDNDHSG